MRRVLALDAEGGGVTDERASQVVTLRESGLTFAEISMITGLSADQCRALIKPAVFSLVTRVAEDGSAWIVRHLPEAITS